MLRQIITGRAFRWVMPALVWVSCCAYVVTALADQSPANPSPEEQVARLGDKIVSVFEKSDAISMKVLYTHRGSNEVSLFGGNKKDETDVRPVVFDLLMAKGGKFRVHAALQGRELVEIACDGVDVVEWDRRANRWTRYPAAKRDGGLSGVRMWTDRAGETSIGSPLSRFAASWVTKPSHYQWFFQRLLSADERTIGTETVSEHQCDVVTVKQVKKNGAMRAENTVRAVYDAGTHLPVLEEIAVRLKIPMVMDMDITAERYDYVKVTRNPPVPPNAFTLKPSGDAEFVDPQELLPMVSALVGKSVADWEVKTVDGKSRKLVDPKGRGPTIVVAWATWCTPCKGELATLARLGNDPDFAKVGIVAVSTNRDAGVLRAFLKQHPQPFSVAWDPDFRERLSVSGVPVTLVLDFKGVVRSMWTGWTDDPASASVVVEKLRRAVREAKE